MKEDKQQSRVRDHLVTAKLTAFWLENISRIITTNPTGDEKFDQEVDRLLALSLIHI